MPIKSLTHKQGSYASQNLSLLMEKKITYETKRPDVLTEHVDVLLTDRYALDVKVCNIVQINASRMMDTCRHQSRHSKNQWTMPIR